MPEGWKYYNHALIPDVLPFEDVNVKCIEDGTIWKTSIGKKAILARWTSDFDCAEKTNWWYLIRKKPFNIDELPKNSRKHIRQALQKCEVRKINPKEYIEDLYRCYIEAHQRYINSDNLASEEQFKRGCMEHANTNIEYWGGFPIGESRMIGYMSVKVYDDFAEILTAKFSAEFLKLQVSDALYTSVLQNYLNVMNKSFVSSGSRSINHITKTQEYKERTFLYQKAYCRLHIKYNPKFELVIKILYFFRSVLQKFDRITLIHQINSVLKMEKIRREKK